MFSTACPLAGVRVAPSLRSPVSTPGDRAHEGDTSTETFHAGGGQVRNLTVSRACTSFESSARPNSFLIGRKQPHRAQMVDVAGPIHVLQISACVLVVVHHVRAASRCETFSETFKMFLLTFVGLRSLRVMKGQVAMVCCDALIGVSF